jgi:hypothetical protein
MGRVRVEVAKAFWGRFSEKRKVSRETWESKMLCLMPSQEGLIYREFDLNI